MNERIEGWLGVWKGQVRYVLRIFNLLVITMGRFHYNFDVVSLNILTPSQMKQALKINKTFTASSDSNQTKV